ncbi:MAG: hypothetical protein COT81_01935 [Candidatus Buchananbacteria bacterium CG10_big_fil_rev_8_21_14_0_10_42_9]|uniref:Gfo/Idh/MocA family oxidoreductase n=1 Tax=Candidatus Buchananbacteria bacterium CG10_big_fil_rev_8_21_14_0_10_42_9 TaxID=1974526 RepID=A0A2H0W1Q4_9BACT|nr:MAG: hypothetical protein COT81_01935 [Candidatus Buchananbacteria bacterium CG10_big_fil_rev_8_21_14_0_10_42_9]
MKILINGFGSIGQRHYKNLKALGFSDIYVFDINKKRLKNKSIKTVSNVTIETLKDFDVVMICNPNNAHVKSASAAVKAGCHVFIEKPLSHSTQGIKELIKLAKQKKAITMVACNMRFHPCLKFIKKYIDAGKLGRIKLINHYFGYYLPKWRPGQDYRKNYAAKRATGGGIILDDIHEFDLLFWLNKFSEVTNSSVIATKLSDLQIETEDVGVAAFTFKNGSYGFVGCDYLQNQYTRTCEVIGSEGKLSWDFNRNIVWLEINNQKKKVYESRKFKVNDMYVDELKYFLRCVKNKAKTFNDFERGFYTLKYCLQR